MKAWEASTAISRQRFTEVVLEMFEGLDEDVEAAERRYLLIEPVISWPLKTPLRLHKDETAVSGPDYSFSFQEVSK